MKLSIFLIFSLIFIQTNDLLAQMTNEQHLELEAHSYSSSQDDLPFWLWANQKGRISEHGKYHQLGLLNFDGALSDTTHHLKVMYGISLVADVTSKSSSPGTSGGEQLNEAFLSIAYKKILLKIGEKATETQLESLSATNGDFYYSNNSRPYPSLLLGTNGFTQLFKNFSFSAVYEEALIRDQFEFIKNPNLHHKNLYLRWGISEKLRITAGLDDYAWWGGTSSIPEHGRLPTGFKDYLRVVLCQPGRANSYKAERDNAAGNHLGQWKLTIEKEIYNQSFLFYLCHPVEERSGNKWQNYPDNLYGLFWKKKQKQSLISSVLIEFYFTRNQNMPSSNSASGIGGSGPVNYFNHFIYFSGFTYKGNVIGVPLFYPVLYDDNGKIIAIANTRFYAFHGGIGGSIVPSDHYKLLVTYSMNSGRWLNPYPSRLMRLSSLFEYTYSCNTHLGVNFGLAHDYIHQGTDNKQVLGGYIGVGWKFF